MGGCWSCGLEEAWALATALRAVSGRSLFLRAFSPAVGLRGGMGAEMEGA